jgi:dTDP-4-dehydrorhamnose 3,5-epimerase-like enzyme
MNLATVEAARIDKLPVMRDARGSLTAIDFAKQVPFPVARLFYVSGVPAGMSRGGHAHRRCNQYMICQAGRLLVAIADGADERSIELSAGQAVLIEPGIFATQTYLDGDSACLVLCDRPYEADDYIHGMDAFMNYRREHE